MIQRFLFDGIHAEAAGTAVRRQDDPIALPRANKAQPLLALVQFAVPRTQVALHAPVVESVPKTSGNGGRSWSAIPAVF
jgi:hypothetical protein